MNGNPPASRPSRPANRLLACLPEHQHRDLFARLVTVSLRPGQVVLRPGAPIEAVYFPVHGVCSLNRITSDGQMAAVAIVGNEGLVGLAALFGSHLDPNGTAAVEIAEGRAQVLEVGAFRREMDGHGAFRDVVNRYAQLFVTCLMQSVVCNALHPAEKRCARCLLDLRDRLGTDDFPLTHDVLASMLGIRRASATLAVGALSRAGLIDHAHRRIAIQDPVGLEAAACECYGMLRRYASHLFPDESHIVRSRTDPMPDHD